MHAFMLVAFICFIPPIVNLSIIGSNSATSGVRPAAATDRKHLVKPSRHSPTVYSVRSLDDLQAKHAHKLHNTSNVFYIKETKSSLYYNQISKRWIELKIKNPGETLQIFPLEYWIPASYCLDTTSGGGGTVSRVITVIFEAAMENYIDIYAGLPTFAIHEAAGLSLGVKIGKLMTVSLLFSCGLNEGEILQMQYRPSYGVVPEMEAILYKLDGKRLRKKKKVKVIKLFKTLIIDAPEHQCWASRNIGDLQCSRPISHKHVIKF